MFDRKQLFSEGAGVINFMSTSSYFELLMNRRAEIKLWHESHNNVVCATSKASDQPVHMHSLIRAFASRLNILRVLLLTEHNMEFLSLKGDCAGSSESTLVKMPHYCWKSHVTAQLGDSTVFVHEKLSVFLFRILCRTPMSMMKLETHFVRSVIFYSILFMKYQLLNIISSEPSQVILY